MTAIRLFLFRYATVGILFGLCQTQAMAAASFYVDWSGAMDGNAAQAHGILTVDDAIFPGSTDYAWLSPGVEVVDFSLTVTGAVSGNGHFQLSDFEFFAWSTKTDTESLDYSRELVGQATLGGPWGTDFGYEANAGDFNLYAVENSGAPSIFGTFQIAANEGLGDTMGLVSFRPVPIPASFWLFGSVMAGFVRFARKRAMSI